MLTAGYISGKSIGSTLLRSPIPKKSFASSDVFIPLVDAISAAYGLMLSSSESFVAFSLSPLLTIHFFLLISHLLSFIYRKFLQADARYVKYQTV